MTDERINLLLIEDSAVDARVMTEMVRNIDTIKMIWVRELASGLERLDQGDVDLVLLDLGLPDSQGLDSLSQVVAHAASVPVIVLTVRVDMEVALEAIRLGAYDYLVKKTVRGPFLENTVRHAIANRHNEQALKVSEQLFRSAFLCAPVGMTLVGVDGRLMWVNQALCDMLDYSIDELSTKRFSDISPAEELASNTQILHRLLSGENSSITSEVALTDRSGGRVFAEILWSLLRHPDDQPIHFIAHIIDITERKHAELTLKENEEIYRSLVETSPDGIFLADLDGSIIRANRQAAELLGYETPTELTGKDGYSLLFTYDKRAAAQKLEEFEKNGCLHNSETRLQRRDGSVCPVELSAQFIRDVDGQPKAMMALFRDISYRKNLESQLVQAQKLESIGQLAAGIAHEINTPAQYVSDNTVFLQRAFEKLVSCGAQAKSLLEMAAAGAIDPEHLTGIKKSLRKSKLDYLTKQVPRAIEQSLEGLERIGNIVAAMKEFSHPSKGDKEPVNLHQAIETTLMVARNEWKYVAETVTDFDPELPPVPCLRDEFNQVILNLVVNAAHAIGDVVDVAAEQKGTITVSTKAEENWAEIAVEDTGGGIPEAVRDKIFDPFFTTKKVGQGTGQGLAIAHSVIVDKHGGSLSVESTADKGARFVIRLPLQEEREGLSP